MATITTNTFLDDGTARIAGEQWVMNGARFTVRTDTRWHIGAPAGMTGTLGTISNSGTLGGGILIDGRNVRWLQYSSGTGNVPAINTPITQGGVAGTLLGVWAGLTSAPSAVGSAMPSTGWLKFREVTGGAFSSGALTGIGATSSGADVVGWIEVVHDASSSYSFNSAGEGIVARGALFQIGVTSGSAGQTMQVPTNGGGANTHVQGVLVETAVGSNQYEWWPATTAAVGWNTTSLGTDARSKFVESTGNGQIRFGSNGTNNIGLVPVSGLNVVIPNILGRVATTGARNTNVIPGSSNTTLVFTGGTTLDIEKAHIDWFLGSIASGGDSVKMDTVAQLGLGITSTRLAATFTNCLFGGYRDSGTTTLVTFGNMRSGFIVSKCTFVSSGGGTSGTVAVSNSSDFEFSDCLFIANRPRTASTRFLVNVATSGDFAFRNNRLIGDRLRLQICSNGLFEGFDYCDRTIGDVSTTQGIIAFRIENSSDIVFDGLTFGLNGTVANQNCADSIFSSFNNIGPIKIRNAGSRTNRIICSASAGPTAIVAASGDVSIEMQRLYFNNIRTANITGQTNIRNMLIEHVYGLQSIQSLLVYPNSIVRGFGSNMSTSTQLSVSGFHYFDLFDSDTSGTFVFTGNRASANTESYVTFNITPNPGTGFSGQGTIMLKTAGDECVIETQYFTKGHTGFQNTDPLLTGTGTANFQLSYQLDTGSGWNGTWKALTGANLSAETLNPAVGFKMKLRIFCSANNTTSTFGFVRIATTSTLAAQADNLYPLDTVPVTLTNLVPGSEVRAYVGLDPETAVEIAGVESSGTTFSFNHSVAGEVGYIKVFALDYQPVVYRPYTYSINPAELLVQQVFDRNYANPA